MDMDEDLWHKPQIFHFILRGSARKGNYGICAHRQAPVLAWKSWEFRKHQKDIFVLALLLSRLFFATLEALARRQLDFGFPGTPPKRWNRDRSIPVSCQVFSTKSYSEYLRLWLRRMWCFSGTHFLLYRTICFMWIVLRHRRTRHHLPPSFP